MRKFRLISGGRQWFTDAADPAHALHLFRVNLGAGAVDPANLVEIGAVTDAKTAKRFDVTVHLPRKRRAKA